MRDAYLCALGDTQHLPSGFGKPDFIEGQLPIALHLEERCLQFPATAGNEDLRARRKPFCAANMTVGPHDDHRLMLCVQAKAFGAEWRWGGEFSRGVNLAHRSNA